jgi:probable selenium-dependent hydroxylase accessory protein YqeC
MSELIDALHARTGTVCAVGAGGKKTTLYRLAGLHPGRVGITSTVPLAHFPGALKAHEVIGDHREIIDRVTEAAADHRIVAFALTDVKKSRHGGLDPQIIADIQASAGFDVVLVKADGARMRWIKAPQDGEPLIPGHATTVVPVVSAKTIGAPLSDKIAHRIELLEAVTGARRDQPITSEHVAQLLASENGALKNVGSATVVPVINMVDDEDLEEAAVEAASLALRLTRRFDRIVLTSMRGPDPLVRIVETLNNTNRAGS